MRYKSASHVHENEGEKHEGTSDKYLGRYGLSDDYYQVYADKVRSLELDEIQATAKKMLNPSELTWLVVGDRAKVEDKIKELGYGEVIPIDSDGNVLSPESQKIEIEGN